VSDAKYETIPGDDARAVPLRLLVVQGEARPPVDATDSPMVMTFPHLLVREVVAFLGLLLTLTIVSLLFDAPLEEIANPERTPNPAKAPWYFLGLQELLHYYPPVISGVILPGMLLTALAIIPYFGVNLERRPLWERDRARRLAAVWTVVAAVAGLLFLTGAHPVWPAIGTVIAVGALMSLGALPSLRGTWLGNRSLAFWIFFWFLLTAAALTVIGVFFRGPGWSYTLPWRDGIY
jgi:hypothetical protein